MPEIQNHWEHFAQTGRVKDYLAYCQEKEKPSATMQITGAEKGDATEYRRNRVKKLPAGRG